MVLMLASLGIGLCWLGYPGDICHSLKVKLITTTLYFTWKVKYLVK